MDTIITYLACIIFIFIFGRIFVIPLKKILKLIFNSCLGAGLIYVINIVGATWVFHVGLNLVTAIIVGVLGVPRRSTSCSVEIANLKNLMVCLTSSDFLRFIQRLQILQGCVVYLRQGLFLLRYSMQVVAKELPIELEK